MKISRTEKKIPKPSYEKYEEEKLISDAEKFEEGKVLSAPRISVNFFLASAHP